MSKPKEYKTCEKCNRKLPIFVLESMEFIIRYATYADIRIKTVDIKNIQDVKQPQQEEYSDIKDKT